MSHNTYVIYFIYIYIPSLSCHKYFQFSVAKAQHAPADRVLWKTKFNYSNTVNTISETTVESLIISASNSSVILFHSLRKIELNAIYVFLLDVSDSFICEFSEY